MPIVSALVLSRVYLLVCRVLLSFGCNFMRASLIEAVYVIKVIVTNRGSKYMGAVNVSITRFIITIQSSL